MNYSRKSSPLRPLFPISMHWLFVSKLETLMESVQRLPRRAASSSERSNSLDELSPEYYFCRKTSSSSPAQTRVVSFAIQMQINELIFKFTNSSLRCQAKSAGQVYLARLSVVSGALWCTDLSQKLIVIHNLYEFIIRSSAQTVPPLSSSTLGQALHFRTIPFAIEADDFTKKSRWLVNSKPYLLWPRPELATSSPKLWCAILRWFNHWNSAAWQPNRGSWIR